jgi:hypothetical protein
LSKAKSIIGILGWGVAKGEIPFITKVIYSLKKLNLEIFAIYHPLFIFLLALGLLRKIYFHFKNEEKYLISFFALHYLVLFLMIFNLTEWRVGEKVQEHVVSGRHMLPLLLFSIYWVGEGFITTYEWVCKKTESILLFHRLTLRKQSVIIPVTLLVLISAIVLPKTLKPQRYERLPEKWAGIWIKSQFGKEMIIFTTAPRVAYYADGNFEYIDFDKDKFEQIKTSMAEKKAIYLAIQGREIANLPQNEEAVKKDLVELARFGGKGMEEIIVYERVH